MTQKQENKRLNAILLSEIKLSAWIRVKTIQVQLKGKKNIAINKTKNIKRRPLKREKELFIVANYIY